MAHVIINSHLSEDGVKSSCVKLSFTHAHSDSPLGVEDAVEGGSPPVLARQRVDGPQVVEGDVALG